MARSSEGCSFHLPSPQRFPWLMISHGSSPSTRVFSFYSFLEKREYMTKIPDLSDKLVSTSCQGWLVVTDPLSSFGCFLLNLASTEKIKLPPFKDFDCGNGNPSLSLTSKEEKMGMLSKYVRGGCVLTAPPTASNCILAFFRTGRPSALIWRPGQENWVIHEYGFEVLRKPMVCNEKIYGVVKTNRLGVCEMVDEKLQVRILGPNLPSPPCTLAGKHLVGSCGDIFLVVTADEEVTQKVRWINVYKLDETFSKWTKVRNIGDRVFFMNFEANFSHPISCTAAANSNPKGNCIYFYTDRAERSLLYTFDMEENRIHVSIPFPNAVKKRSMPRFIMLQP